MVVNIQTMSRLVEKNAVLRNTVEWFIKFTIQLLSAQRLLDDRKLQAISLDWERGTINLGSSFSEQLVARSISKYYLDVKLDQRRNKVSLEKKSDSDIASRANFNLSNSTR